MNGWMEKRNRKGTYEFFLGSSSRSGIMIITILIVIQQMIEEALKFVQMAIVQLIKKGEEREIVLLLLI